MAPLNPKLAFIINDQDYVLARCNDDGIGDVLASASKTDPDWKSPLLATLSELEIGSGTSCIVMVPYETLTYGKIRRKDLETSSLEEAFERYLDGDPSTYEIDTGIASKAGTYTPVAIQKEALESAIIAAEHLGLKPIGLSTLFPKKIRSPQPFFAASGLDRPAEPRPRYVVPALMAAALLIMIAIGLTPSVKQGLLSLVQTEAPTVANTNLDSDLLRMLHPPRDILRVDAAEPSERLPAGSFVFAKPVSIIASPTPPAVVTASTSRPILKSPEPEEELPEEPDVAVLVITPDEETLRPTPRPDAMKLSDAPPGLGALATSIIPKVRPDSVLEQSFAAAAASAAQENSTTSENAQDAATTRGRTLSRNELSLIGIFGRPNAREAMFRTSSGRFVTRTMGERIATWQIVAIGADQVKLAKGNRTETLRLPN